MASQINHVSPYNYIPKLNYYDFCYRLGHDLAPLDWSILNLLLDMSRRGGRSAFGLSARRIVNILTKRMEMDGVKRPNLKLHEILEHLKGLQRLGLVYSINCSRARWFPSSKLVVASGFAKGTQRSIMEFLR